jgi:hypothetical protein
VISECGSHEQVLGQKTNAHLPDVTISRIINLGTLSSANKNNNISQSAVSKSPNTNTWHEEHC